MKKLEKKVLAEGEVTGHSHTITVDVFDDGGVRMFDAPNGTLVKHQEHHEVELPPNTYDSDKVVEYDPITEMVRKVTD